MIVLEKYEGHLVVAETDNKKIFRGTAIDYLAADENEDGQESIIIRDMRTQKLVELFEHDIKNIDIVK